MSKIVTLAAAAAGYVLGARAGRERYEQIATAAGKVWGDPRVQKARAQAEQTARQQAPVVKDKVTEAASAAASTVKEKVADATGGSGPEAQGAGDDHPVGEPRPIP